MKKRRCLLSVSCGSFHNALSDFMVESFLRYNKGWDVRKVRDNEIHVPVVCMKDGNIVEKGDHEELIRKKGFYYSLYRSQFLGNAI